LLAVCFADDQIYSVIAAVVLDRSEADFDFHLVLRQASRTMIAKSPFFSLHEGCDLLPAQADVRRPQGGPHLHEGLGGWCAFFDFNHGQKGVAPNAIELHPVLGFACRA
jgi:hypothetical protein